MLLESTAMATKCITISQVTENLRGRKTKNLRSITEVLQDTSNNPTSPGTPSDSHFKQKFSASTPASLNEKCQRNQPKPQVPFVLFWGVQFNIES